MTYGELPVGTEFYFGRMDVRSYYGQSVKQDIKWVKVTEDNMAMCERAFSGYMDAPRCATGNNRAVRKHGNSFFPKTYLRALLNAQSERCVRVADGDEVPYFELGGFLSVFTEEELKILEPFNTKYTTPDGYIKEFGKEYVDRTYVSVPSYEDLAYKFKYNTEHLSRRYRILTSSVESKCCVADFYGDSISKKYTFPNSGTYILPVIKIKAGTDMSQSTDGLFRIDIKEKMLTENIMNLIGD